MWVWGVRIADLKNVPAAGGLPTIKRNLRKIDGEKK
jgi:hypothetical protein